MLQPEAEFVVLVVLYKMPVRQCATLLSLERCSEALQQSRLVVWDNSPTKIDAKSQDWIGSLARNVDYRYDGSNTPLSVIYNRVIAQAEGKGHLVILDQDSHFYPDYFASIREARQLHLGVNLYVPLITHQRKIMSPGWYYTFRGGYRRQISYGWNSSRHMAVISSGMCIALHWLKTGFEGFNERLTFYGIDTFFSIQYRRHNSGFVLLQCRFDHSLSNTEDEPYPVKKQRFDNHRASLLELTRQKNPLIRLASWLYVQWEKFKFWIKHFNKHA